MSARPPTIAFVLTSWRPDAPAGMERAVAAHAISVAATGGTAIIVTADRTAPPRYRGLPVVRLAALDQVFPCDDDTLRTTIDRAADAIRTELTDIYTSNRVDGAIYVDALWGLGRVMPQRPGTRNVLAVHVVGHRADLDTALEHQPAAVIAPSDTVLAQAADRGYDTSGWHVVPNTLLATPPRPPDHDRERLRLTGPVRILARLGPEKGVVNLLSARPGIARPIEIALADAPFEKTDGSQQRLRHRCQVLASERDGVTLKPGMAWDEVSPWLCGAAVVIVPSHAETFGLVALEAMAAGTPVVAYDVGNLPHLVGDGGVIVPHQFGPDGLWRAARHLLADPVRFRRIARGAYYRSRDYWPAQVANQLLKVVS